MSKVVQMQGMGRKPRQWTLIELQGDLLLSVDEHEGSVEIKLTSADSGQLAMVQIPLPFEVSRVPVRQRLREPKRAS